MSLKDFIDKEERDLEDKNPLMLKRIKATQYENDQN
jgi:hypothetical protein